MYDWLLTETERGKHTGKDILRIDTAGDGAERIERSAQVNIHKFRGFTGTGLAQPKPNRNMHSVPIGSRWRAGFRDKRPSIFAVGSPHL